VEDNIGLKKKDDTQGKAQLKKSKELDGTWKGIKER